MKHAPDAGGPMTPSPLSPDEELVMKMTMKATMIRAANIISRITQDDVLGMQARGLREGMTLENVAKIDRANIAEAHLRMIAASEAAEGV